MHDQPVFVRLHNQPLFVRLHDQPLFVRLHACVGYNIDHNVQESLGCCIDNIEVVYSMQVYYIVYTIALSIESTVEARGQQYLLYI